MSRQKLTIIVTCTDRKSAPPHRQLMARNLPRGEVEARAQLWTQAVASSAAPHRIVDLYRGDTWTQVKRLVATADEMGYRPEVRVASAGLGLRSLEDRAPAYAATFATNHADSVARSVSDANRWWRSLPQTPVRNRDRAIWVLSQMYSSVIGSDLLQALSPSELLVFGGTAELPDDVRIPSDRSLRRALGGTVTSLNVRAAVQWLRMSNDTDPFSNRAKKRWQQWSANVRHEEQYDRRPVSDVSVVDFIRKIRQDQPGISKTRALRVLRDSGVACEQRRFSDIFHQAVAR